MHSEEEEEEGNLGPIVKIRLHLLATERPHIPLSIVGSCQRNIVLGLSAIVDYKSPDSIPLTPDPSFAENETNATRL